ncbi:DUF2914 domain-containing protein [Desulfobacter curvatus]|uniref:DUF2914 domain-containing protein n=1 Tax=Desulfobacter curvatus TaxID=2290 RepID=UPI000373EFAA|nr:DUF2914 domain-containing protein [Desulfobacter curvatus]
MKNRTSIEDRDRHLMKKFRNIIEEKEQRKEQFKQQAPQRPSWPVFMMAGFIVAAGIMFMIYRMIPERALTETPSTPEKVETVSPRNPASMVQDTLTDVEQPDIPNEKPSQALPPETAPVPPAKETPPHSEIVQTLEKAAPKKTLPKIVSSTDVTIQELVICRSIKNRQYMSPENRFSMANDARPVVWTWMNVLTDKPPQVLSHIYYLNGKRFCRVILPAPYPRTRTWSKVTLNKPAHAGSWRVDVVNSSGQVIARTDFTVEI